MKGRIVVLMLIACAACAQTSAKTPTHEEVSKIAMCVVENCADFSGWEKLDSYNYKAEFTQNHKRSLVFVSLPLPLAEFGRLDFEVRPEGSKGTVQLESFGSRLDGKAFAESAYSYGYVGERPDRMSLPFFSPNNPGHWQNRFNEAVAQTLAFINSRPK